jgi:hypothetical protein
MRVEQEEGVRVAQIEEGCEMRREVRGGWGHAQGGGESGCLEREMCRCRRAIFRRCVSCFS